MASRDRLQISSTNTASPGPAALLPSSGSSLPSQAPTMSPRTLGAQAKLPVMPPACAESLRHLISEIERLGSIDADKSAQVYKLLQSLHERRHDIEKSIALHAGLDLFKRFSAKLNPFLKALAEAIADGRLELKLLSNIETLCLGLTSCTDDRGGSAIASSNFQALRDVTETILEAVRGPLASGASKSPGQVLNIVNWIPHALKAGILIADDVLRQFCGGNLRLLGSWARSAQSHDWDAHNLGKCATQLNLYCNSKYKLINFSDQELKQCLQDVVVRLCSPRSCELLWQLPFNPVPLSIVCTLLRSLIQGRLVSTGDAFLPGVIDCLVSPLNATHARALLQGDTRALLKPCNLLRVLINLKVDEHIESAMAARWARAAAALLRSCIDPAFKSLNVWPHDLANLLNLQRACQLWRARSTDEAVQAALPASLQAHAVTTAVLDRFAAADLGAMDDAELARSLLNFLNWARAQELMPIAAIDSSLQDVLSSIGAHGAHWDHPLQTDILATLRLLLQAEPGNTAVQTAVTALLGPREDGTPWTAHDMASAQPRPRARPMQAPLSLAMPPQGDAQSDQHRPKARMAIPGDTQILAPEPKPWSEPAPAPPVLAGRRSAGAHYIEQRNSAKPILPDSFSMAVHAALQDMPASTPSEEDDELDGASTPGAPAQSGETAKPTRSTAEKQDWPSSLDQQLAEVPSQYTLHAAPITHDFRLNREREELGISLMTDLMIQLAKDLKSAASAPAPSAAAKSATDTDRILQQLFNKRYSTLLDAFATDQADTVQRLLDTPDGARLLQHRDGARRTVLQIAIARGAWKVVDILLPRSEVQELAGQADNVGNTALIVAAWRGNVRVLRTLLGIPQVVSGVLARRAVLGSHDIVVRSARWKAMFHEQQTSGKTLFMEPDPFMFDMLPEEGDRGRDALQIAVKAGHAQCAQVLLDRTEVQNALRQPRYAIEVLQRVGRLATPELIQTLMAIEGLHAPVANCKAHVLIALISARKTECVRELLRWVDAKTVLATGDKSQIDAFDLARRLKLEDILKVLTEAWNAAPASPRKTGEDKGE